MKFSGTQVMKILHFYALNCQFSLWTLIPSCSESILCWNKCAAVCTQANIRSESWTTNCALWTYVFLWVGSYLQCLHSHSHPGVFNQCLTTIYSAKRPLTQLTVQHHMFPRHLPLIKTQPGCVGQKTQLLHTLTCHLHLCIISVGKQSNTL